MISLSVPWGIFLVVLFFVLGFCLYFFSPYQIFNRICRSSAQSDPETVIQRLFQFKKKYFRIFQSVYVHLMWLFNIGAFYKEIGKKDQAEELLTEATEIVEKNNLFYSGKITDPILINNIASLWMNKQEYGQALRFFQPLLKIEKKISPLILANIAICFMKESNPLYAIHVLHLAGADRENAPSILKLLLIKAIAAANFIRDALNSCFKFQNDYPEVQEAKLLMFLLLMKSEGWIQAKAIAEKNRLDHDPNLIYRLHYATCLWELKEYDKLKIFLDELLKCSKNTDYEEQVWTYICKVSTETGLQDDCDQSLRKIIISKNPSPDTFQSIIMAYVKFKKINELKDYLRSVHPLVNLDAQIEAIAFLTMIDHVSDEWLKRKDLYEKALSGHELASHHMSVAILLNVFGNLDLMMEMVQKAISDDPEWYYPHLFLARLETDKPFDNGQIALWKKVLDLTPDDERVHGIFSDIQPIFFAKGELYDVYKNFKEIAIEIKDEEMTFYSGIALVKLGISIDHTYPYDPNFFFDPWGDKEVTHHDICAILRPETQNSFFIAFSEGAKLTETESQSLLKLENE